MSRSLGALLPDGLLGWLLGHDAAVEAARVTVLLTVDPFGWPHPALVSYGELLALDAGRLRLGLQAGSRTSRHLRESGRVTLVFAEAEVVLYVKAEAVPLPDLAESPGLARFELAVRDVLEDRATGAEAGVRLVSGLAVEWPGGGQAAADRVRRTRDALRR